MTTSAIAEPQAFSTDALTARAVQPMQGKWEYVFLYGYAYEESNGECRLYHGPGFPQYYSLKGKTS